MTDNLEKYEALAAHVRESQVSIPGNSVWQTCNAITELVAMVRSERDCVAHSEQREAHLKGRAEAAEQRNAVLLKLVRDAQNYLRTANSRLLFALEGDQR